jgi:hypothetical protein
MIHGARMIGKEKYNMVFEEVDNVIKFLEARFGHYNLKIPVDWVKRSEYVDSDDDDGGDSGEAHID